MREDVVAAVRDQRFSVHAIDDVDQALGLLTGVPDARGQLPEGSLNQRVAARLAQLSRLRQAFEMGLTRPLPQAARRRERKQHD